MVVIKLFYLYVSLLLSFILQPTACFEVQRFKNGDEIDVSEHDCSFVENAMWNSRLGTTEASYCSCPISHSTFHLEDETYKCMSRKEIDDVCDVYISSQTTTVVPLLEEKQRSSGEIFGWIEKSLMLKKSNLKNVAVWRGNKWTSIKTETKISYSHRKTNLKVTNFKAYSGHLLKITGVVPIDESKTADRCLLLKGAGTQNYSATIPHVVTTKKKSNTAGIVVGVFVALLFLCLLVAAIFYYRRYKKTGVKPAVFGMLKKDKGKSKEQHQPINRKNGTEPSQYASIDVQQVPESIYQDLKNPESQLKYQPNSNTGTKKGAPIYMVTESDVPQSPVYTTPAEPTSPIYMTTEPYFNLSSTPESRIDDQGLTPDYTQLSSSVDSKSSHTPLMS